MSPHLLDLIQYAHSIQSPYVYGGENPRTGLDCSAYVNLILRSVGLVGLREDLRAIDLYHKFTKAPHCKGSLVAPAAGSLLFYGHSVAKISHVSFVVSPYSILECAGGDSTTISIEIADKINARVRKCGINLRSDKVACAQPHYPWDL